jgi:hypothetical protein
MAMLGCIILFGGYYAMNATETSSAATPQSTANVTLEIYSGRPDPTWALDDASLKTLRERVAALKATAPDTPVFEGLGYRGIRVAITAPDALSSVSVSRGIVTVERGSEKSRFVDSGRELELWLVKSGEKTLTPTLFKQVTDKIIAAPR